MSRNDTTNDNDDSDVDVAFASVDFSGVNFDGDGETEAASNRLLETWEESLAFQDFSWTITKDESMENKQYARVLELGKFLGSGKYADVLRSQVATQLFDAAANLSAHDASVFAQIKGQIKTEAKDTECILALEMIGVAALNLFLQANYCGPALGDTEGGMEAYTDIHPHAPFQTALKANQKGKTSVTVTHKSGSFQNAVLAELAVDGDWPCQVCEVPYFLLVARAVLESLAQVCTTLPGVQLWHTRALVAHQRLLQIRQVSVTLATLIDKAFENCTVAADTGGRVHPRAATVLLEKGLADHHLDRTGKGRKFFVQAQGRSGLQIEVTGATGKRTKFQQEATAQLLVRAQSTASSSNTTTTDKKSFKDEIVKGQLVEHSEEEILLERVKFDEDKENEILALNTLDQSIVLALCLDVKNSNPADGLTAEEMGAFLARVLDHHDDWMIYSTGLLERSWLEFERTHARERAILQMQALTDQHTNRLTITQSTTQSIEESAQVQDRLRNLHQIVYPPRWEIVQDLADRYATLGVVTSAAELYTEVELWDDVVSCYTRAGKKSKAEEIVRERLGIQETPRMWAALGDLTGEPEHYEKAANLSHGRFSHAYVCLGQYYFEKGQLEDAARNYEAALKVRPLSPSIWFRLGTICMQLKHWDMALRAFTEVVQQEPEEGEAWANVAAIHMHNKQATEAYPALNEALKYQRNSWRMWVSKLYTCLDLEKYDEAIQACNMLMDLRDRRGVSDNVPPLEEKCVRAIVGGTIDKLQESINDEAAVESARRSLSRTHALLERINSSNQNEPWVLETLAFFHEQVGKDENVLDYLMQEYRTLQGVAGWEKDNFLIKKISDVVVHIASIHKEKGTKEHITKARFLVRGVVRRIQSVHIEATSVPPEVTQLEKVLSDLENLP